MSDRGHKCLTRPFRLFYIEDYQNGKVYSMRYMYIVKLLFICPSLQKSCFIRFATSITKTANPQ